jgi:hypothetical protein
MKVYVILERDDEYEVAISKIFSSRKKARKYVSSRYYVNLDASIKCIDSWITVVNVE